MSCEFAWHAYENVGELQAFNFKMTKPADFALLTNDLELVHHVRVINLNCYLCVFRKLGY
jgi:hypothetical protein